MNEPIVDIKIKDSKQNHLVITDFIKNLSISEAIAYLKVKYSYKKEIKTKTLIQELNEKEQNILKDFMEE